jgi:hypothetical protein
VGVDEVVPCVGEAPVDAVGVVVGVGLLLRREQLPLAERVHGRVGVLAQEVMSTGTRYRPAATSTAGTSRCACRSPAPSGTRTRLPCTAAPAPRRRRRPSAPCTCRTPPATPPPPCRPLAVAAGCSGPPPPAAAQQAAHVDPPVPARGAEARPPPRGPAPCLPVPRGIWFL